MSGDFEAMALYAGEGAGLITSVPPAAERLKSIVNEALGVLGTEPTQPRKQAPLDTALRRARCTK